MMYVWVYMPLHVAVIDHTNMLYPILLKMKDVEVVLLYGPSDHDMDEYIKLGYNETQYVNDILPTTWSKTFVSKEDIIKYGALAIEIKLL